MIRYLLLGLALMLAGCATLTAGTTQMVSINTPNVAGATCTLSSSGIGTVTVVTPANLPVKKYGEDVAVRCQKECYSDGVGTLPTTVEPMVAGNILVGGFIGLGVDTVSGAINKYPPNIDIAMAPIAACAPRVASR
jgi:hypothetical protein